MGALGKAAAGVGLLVWSWALVVTADARHDREPTPENVRVVTVEVIPERNPTPIADSLVDWEEHHRQTNCLWVFLQDHFGYDITLERVLAAGYWTDELGGACKVIGEDDE